MRNNVLERISYDAMMSRCYKPKNNRYYLYGGRGITVCDRWRASFRNFLEDMGPRPSREYSIDRIDPNGNYEPGNCRWATRSQQARNTRSKEKLFALNGQALTIAEWAKKSGVSYQSMRCRIKEYGWPLEKALTSGPREYVQFKQRPVKKKAPKVNLRYRMLTHHGKTQSIRAWAKELGINRFAIARRLNNGMPIEQALANL